MKRFLLSIVCLLALVGGSGYIGRTLALQQNRLADKQPGIQQTIYARENEHSDTLEPFSQNVTLLPCVYESDAALEDKAQRTVSHDGKAFSVNLWQSVVGAKDYFVTVKNERGDAACYFRTYIALEDNGVFSDQIVLNWNDKTLYQVEDLGTMDLTVSSTVNETPTDESGSYRVFKVTYQRALGVEKTAAPSLMQLAMRREADNRNIAALGERYTIISVSEAIWQDSALNETAAAEEAKLINSPAALDYLSIRDEDGKIIKDDELARIKGLLERGNR